MFTKEVRLFGMVRLLIFDLCAWGYGYLGWYVYLEVYSTLKTCLKLSLIQINLEIRNNKIVDSLVLVNIAQEGTFRK